MKFIQTKREASTPTGQNRQNPPGKLEAKVSMDSVWISESEEAISELELDLRHPSQQRWSQIKPMNKPVQKLHESL